MLADVYVLANSRTAAQVERFLDRFLPRREESACEYVVPQCSDQPERILTDVAELLRLCERRPELYQSVYWNHATLGGEPHSAHVFFLADGGLILGLSTADWYGADGLLTGPDKTPGYPRFSRRFGGIVRASNTTPLEVRTRPAGSGL